MINPMQQSYVVNITLNTNRIDKEVKANDTQKTENDRASKVAEQIKNSTYKIDIKATVAVIVDSLI